MRFSPVQREEEPAGTNPAKGDTRVAHVVLTNKEVRSELFAGLASDGAVFILLVISLIHHHQLLLFVMSFVS